MESSCRLQSELGRPLWDSLDLAVSLMMSQVKDHLILILLNFISLKIMMDHKKILIVSKVLLLIIMVVFLIVKVMVFHIMTLTLK